MLTKTRLRFLFSILINILKRSNPLTKASGFQKTVLYPIIWSHVYPFWGVTHFENSVVMHLIYCVHCRSENNYAKHICFIHRGETLTRERFRPLSEQLQKKWSKSVWEFAYNFRGCLLRQIFSTIDCEIQQMMFLAHRTSKATPFDRVKNGGSTK